MEQQDQQELDDNDYGIYFFNGLAIVNMPNYSATYRINEFSKLYSLVIGYINSNIVPPTGSSNIDLSSYKDFIKVDFTKSVDPDAIYNTVNNSLTQWIKIINDIKSNNILNKEQKNMVKKIIKEAETPLDPEKIAIQKEIDDLTKIIDALQKEQSTIYKQVTDADSKRLQSNDKDGTLAQESIKAHINLGKVQTDISNSIAKQNKLLGELTVLSQNSQQKAQQDTQQVVAATKQQTAAVQESTSITMTQFLNRLSTLISEASSTPETPKKYTLITEDQDEFSFDCIYINGISGILCEEFESLIEEKDGRIIDNETNFEVGNVKDGKLNMRPVGPSIKESREKVSSKNQRYLVDSEDYEGYKFVNSVKEDGEKIIQGFEDFYKNECVNAALKTAKNQPIDTISGKIYICDGSTFDDDGEPKPDQELIGTMINGVIKLKKGWEFNPEEIEDNVIATTPPVVQTTVVGESTSIKLQYPVQAKNNIKIVKEQEQVVKEDKVPDSINGTDLDGLMNSISDQILQGYQDLVQKQINDKMSQIQQIIQNKVEQGLSSEVVEEPINNEIDQTKIQGEQVKVPDEEDQEKVEKLDQVQPEDEFKDPEINQDLPELNDITEDDEPTDDEDEEVNEDESDDDKKKKDKTEESDMKSVLDEAFMRIFDINFKEVVTPKVTDVTVKDPSKLMGTKIKTVIPGDKKGHDSVENQASKLRIK